MKKHLAVLVASDDSGLREKIRGIVHQFDPSLLMIDASNGADAARKVELQRFAFAIVDEKTSKKEGYQVVRSFEEMEAHQKPQISILLTNDDQKLPEVKTLQKSKIESELPHFLREFLKPQTAAPKKGVDTVIIQPFLSGIKRVFEVMAQVDVEVEGEVFVKEENTSSGDISAIMEVKAKKYSGSVALSFPKTTYLALTNKIFMTEETTINEENEDMCGEFCNQMFGQAKIVMNKHGHDLIPALPTIITGEKHKIKHMVGGRCIVANLKTQYGSFTVELVAKAV